MPKITVRDDGTCFVRASVHPGSGEVRAWEVKKEGVAWLRRQGIGVEQEMGRFLFQQLLDLKYAYIANRTAKSTTPVPKIKSEIVSGPAGTHRVFTIKASGLKMEGTSSRKPKRRKQRRVAKPIATPLAITTPPDPPNSTVPEHWNRRTKKKDWFE